MKRKKIIIGIMFLCVVVVIGVCIALYFNKIPRTFSLRTSPVLPNTYYVRKNTLLRVKVDISQAQGLFQNNINEQVLVEIFLNKKTIYTKEIKFKGANSSSQSFLYPLEINLLADGKYPLLLQLKDPKTKKVQGNISSLLIVDTTPPTLEEITAKQANIYRYVTSEDKTATQPAKLGVSLYTNTKKIQSLLFSFSEKGIFKTDISKEMANFTETKESTTEALLTFTPIKNEWSAPYSFSDAAGNTIRGEIHFVFDATPPQLSGTTRYTVDKNSRNNFMATFTSSETLSYSTGTVNGITKVGSGSGTHYAVKNLPLTQDNNTITITAQDLAGNTGSMQIEANVKEYKTFNSLDEVLKYYYGKH